MGQPSSRVGEIWKRYRGRIVTLVVLALVVFPLLFAFNVLPGLPPEKVAQTQVSYSKMPRDSGLSVSLEAPPSRLSASANVALELILTNTGANPIKIKALSTSGCLQLINLNPPMLIRAHQSIRRSPALRLQCLSGQFLLTLFFTWEEGSSSAEYEGFAATSPITALSSTYEFWQRFISIDSFLLRTFSLPLVLLLVGYFLQVSQTERDAKLKEDQADRDAKLKVEQDARDSRSQILNTLLPEYSKLVQEHYLTITSRFERVFFETKDYRTNPQNKSQPATASGQSSAPPEPERVLCSILLMRAQIVKLVTEKGGIYFASSVAEDLFFEAFTHFLKRCRDEMGIEDFGAAVELVDAKDTPTIALSKCRDARLFTTILPRFSAWLRTDGFDEYLRLLHISNAVLSFECNRPFYQVGQAVNDRERDAYLGNWYVDPPMLRMTGEMYKVPEIARPDVLKLLRRWLGNIPKECKEGVPDIPD